ncbi:MAG: hypothetical protein MZW92_28160 [Comamonadaceae bacterium]|nr:hypothetical protein [Comamonadaceae bacterium]
MHHTYRDAPPPANPRPRRRRRRRLRAADSRCRSSSSTSAPDRRLPGPRPPRPSSSGPRYERAAPRHLPRLERCAEDFSLYLHAPTRDRPHDGAPQGCEAFYVLSPVPAPRHARGSTGRRRGLRYADRILALPGEALHARTCARTRHHAGSSPRSTSATALQRLRMGSALLGGAEPHPERLVPASTTATTADPRPLHRGGGHAPGRGRARRRQLGQGHGGASCWPISAWRRAVRIGDPWTHSSRKAGRR